MTNFHKFRLSKEYLAATIEKYLERGFIYRLQLPAKQTSKLKKLGIIAYNDKKYYYEIKIDAFNKLKKELDDTN